MAERPTRRRRGRAGFLRGWGEFAFMVAVGGSFTVAGLALAVGGRGAERVTGAVAALFFFACLLTAPMFAPRRRRGRPRLATVHLDGREQRGVVVPYSGPGTALLLVAAACMALACLGLAVSGAPWPARLVGGVGAAFFGLGTVAGARQGWGRRWQVLLTPTAVVVAAGRGRTVVPWTAIRQVRPTQVTTSARGLTVREPLLGIDVHDLTAVRTTRLGRLLLPLNRRLAADVALPVRTLAVDPDRLREVLTWYQQHPEARAELAGAEGLARLAGG
jgi:hypothetical protein